MVRQRRCDYLRRIWLSKEEVVIQGGRGYPRKMFKENGDVVIQGRRDYPRKTCLAKEEGLAIEYVAGLIRCHTPNA